MLRILLIKKDESTKTHNFKVLNIIGKNDKNCEINFFLNVYFKSTCQCSYWSIFKTTKNKTNCSIYRRFQTWKIKCYIVILSENIEVVIEPYYIY